VNLLEALQHGAIYSAADEDEPRAREVGALISAVRNVLFKKRIGTIEELRKALGVQDPVKELKETTK